MRSGKSAAAELKQTLRLLDRCQPDVIPSLRRALGIVQSHPLHDDEQWEVEQHLEIALGFLATPHAVSEQTRKSALVVVE